MYLALLVDHLIFFTEKIIFVYNSITGTSFLGHSTAYVRMVREARGRTIFHNILYCYV